MQARTKEGEDRQGTRPGERSSTNADRTRERPERENDASDRGTGTHLARRLQRSHGNRAVQRLVDRHLRPELSVGRPDDRYEREAERVGERIAGRSDPSRTDVDLAAPPVASGPVVRPRASVDDQDLRVPSVVQDVLRSPGRPLPPATREFMERRFGHDFTGVRVHTDRRAAASARAIDALAYTAGSDIVFAAGEYAPRNGRGRALLAHELTHVVQQGATGGTTAASEPVQRAIDPISAAGLGVAVFGLVSGMVTQGAGLTWSRNIGKAIHDWPAGKEPSQDEWMRDWSDSILHLSMIPGLSSAWGLFSLMWNWNGADIDQAYVTKYASSDWSVSGANITFEMQDASNSYEEGGKAAMICYINGSADPAGGGDIDFEGRVLLFADGSTRRLGDLRITRGDESDFTIRTRGAGWTIEKR